MGFFFEDKKDVLVCPKCGSINKENAGNMSTDYVVGSGFTGRPLGPSLYKCKDCGFEGPFFLIDKNELNDFCKELKNKKEI